MSQATQGYVLPCGRDVEEVWERIDEVDAGRATAHELDCAQCRTARDSLRVLRELTGELAADDSEPSLELTGRIMSAVRADIRRRDVLPLPTKEPGGIRVSVAAVAAVLRFAADTVEGVRARRCRVTTSEEPDFAIDVELSVAMSYRGFANNALDEVRERVSAAAGARVGIRIARLDLTLDDLYED